MSKTILPENIQRDRFKRERNTIGLYKIRYEMDVANSSRDHHYVAGIVAYTDREAVDTLVAFCKKKVTGFKGMRISEMSFDGFVHDLSASIKDAVIRTATLEGEIVKKSDYDALLKESKKKTKKTSVIPKKD